MRLFWAWSVAISLASPAVAQGWGSVHSSKIDRLPTGFVNAKPLPPLQDDGPHVLLRIEYPAALSPAALERLTAHVRRTGSPVVTNGLDDDYIQIRLLDQLNKSTYYAAKLYRYLRDSGDYPPDTLVLQPVYLDAPVEAGQLVSTKRPENLVPAVATLRFAAFRPTIGDVSTPRPIGKTDIKILATSFGDIFTPTTILATEPAAWPGSAGTVFRSIFGMHSSNCVSDRCDLPLIQALACEAPQCVMSAPDIGDVLVGDIPLPAIVGRVTSGDNAKSLAYPLATDFGNIITRCDINDTKPPSPCPYERFLRSAIRASFDNIDPYLATRYQWRHYIERFDPSLASYWPGGVLAPEVIPAASPRLHILRQIMKGERRFIAGLSDQLAAQALDGQNGAAMRAQLGAEKEFGQAIGNAARPRLDLGSVLSMAQAFAGIGGAMRGSDLSPQIAAATRAMERDIASGQRRISAIQQIGAAYTDVSRTFASGMKAAIDPSLLPGLDQGEASFDTLRSRLKTLYSERSFVSLPKPESMCRKYQEPSLDVDFLGICDQKLGQAVPRFGNSVYHTNGTDVYVGEADVIDGVTVYFSQAGVVGQTPVKRMRYQTSGYTGHQIVLGYVLTRDRTTINKTVSEKINYSSSENGIMRRSNNEEISLIEKAARAWSSASRSLIYYDVNR